MKNISELEQLDRIINNLPTRQKNCLLLKMAGFRSPEINNLVQLDTMEIYKLNQYARENIQTELQKLQLKNDILLDLREFEEKVNTITDISYNYLLPYQSSLYRIVKKKPFLEELQNVTSLNHQGLKEIFDHTKKDVHRILYCKDETILDERTIKNRQLKIILKNFRNEISKEASQAIELFSQNKTHKEIESITHKQSSANLIKKTYDKYKHWINDFQNIPQTSNEKIEEEQMKKIIMIYSTCIQYEDYLTDNQIKIIQKIQLGYSKKDLSNIFKVTRKALHNRIERIINNFYFQNNQAYYKEKIRNRNRRKKFKSLQQKSSEQMTPYETSVVSLILEGHSNLQIAKILCCKEDRIKDCIKRIYKKYDQNHENINNAQKEQTIKILNKIMESHKENLSPESIIIIEQVIKGKTYDKIAQKHNTTRSAIASKINYLKKKYSYQTKIRSLQNNSKLQRKMKEVEEILTMKELPKEEKLFLKIFSEKGHTGIMSQYNITRSGSSQKIRRIIKNYEDKISSEEN